MCDCIEQIDAKLAERNSKLQIGFTFGTPDRPGYTFPALTTDKIDKRNRDKMGAIPTFCPFCGERYVAIPEAPQRPEADRAPAH
ncbi:MAG: hypothetical protein K0S00_4444 [Xanthobacteraceae bacterium]|jgi:hypothetical protein|nr:hypothetical protein [Xanthobacteraceae bacterium]